MKKCSVAIGCLVLLAGCMGNRPEKSVVRSVKADTVRVYGLNGSNTFPGTVAASSDINLSFRVSGPILRVNAEVGSYVEKGEVLAVIDPRDYEIQLDATEAEYNRIKSETDRVSELYEKGTVTPNDYDKARFGYQQISAKLEAHRSALNDTRLRAPIDGYIQKRLFEPGETVSEGMPVISMISSGIGEVEINISSSDYIRRDQFHSYFCTSDIFPGITFPLELIGITRKANVNQLYTVRFRLKEDDGDLPEPGMSTMVTIRYKNEETEMVSIPISSVFQSENRSAVWIYDPDSQTVSARAVTLTQILADGTAVLSSGLHAGEIVLTAGIHSVAEGEKVKLLPSVSPTNIGGML